MERMSSLKTDDKSLYKFRNHQRDGARGKKIKTRVEMCTVAACRTAIRVRIGGDFFYGKSGNENHIKGL